MKLEYDDVKRRQTLQVRKLDMADAGLVFAGPTLSYPDIRLDYGEARTLTVGYLHGRMVILCWTLRDDTYRIISMRKTNARETEAYRGRLGLGTG